MQRNNAKDDAVKGGDDGERPPSSQPIAPAVAGQAPPQPARKSIAYSAVTGETVRIRNLTAAIRPVCELNRLLLAILPRWTLAAQDTSDTVATS